MSRWWWVRHGPTHAKSFVGSTDLPADLSDTAALARLSGYLPADAIVVSSDLLRARATADAIQNNRHRLDHLPELKEIDFGDWEMKTFHQVSESHPDLARSFWSDPDMASPPNGESWKSMCNRVHAAVSKICEMHPGRDIVAVAHMGVIVSQLQMAANIGPRQAMSFSIDNLSVTRLEFLDPDWRILGVNHCP